eukprot:6202419-Pleurochrysis_carterae.AAC.4
MSDSYFNQARSFWPAGVPRCAPSFASAMHPSASLLAERRCETAALETATPVLPSMMSDPVACAAMLRRAAC